MMERILLAAIQMYNIIYTVFSRPMHSNWGKITNLYDIYKGWLGKLQTLILGVVIMSIMQLVIVTLPIYIPIK